MNRIHQLWMMVTVAGVMIAASYIPSPHPDDYPIKPNPDAPLPSSWVYINIDDASQRIKLPALDSTHVGNPSTGEDIRNSFDAHTKWLAHTGRSPHQRGETEKRVGTNEVEGKVITNGKDSSITHVASFRDIHGPLALVANRNINVPSGPMDVDVRSSSGLEASPRTFPCGKDIRYGIADHFRACCTCRTLDPATARRYPLITCDLCHKSFAHNSVKKAHDERVHKAPLKCKFCRETSPDKASLNKHSMACHGLKCRNN